MFRSISKKTAITKAVSFLLAVLVMVAAIPTFIGANNNALAATKVSSYDFEDIEYNHTPEFPCVADSTVVVYPDPVNANNKALLVE